MGGGPPPAPQRTTNSGPPETRPAPAQQQRGPGGGMVACKAPVVFATATQADVSTADYPFTMEQFHRAIELHGLNGCHGQRPASVASRGGKLIMYDGQLMADWPSPATTIRFLRYTLGKREAKQNDQVVRFVCGMRDTPGNFYRERRPKHKGAPREPGSCGQVGDCDARRRGCDRTHLDDPGA